MSYDKPPRYEYDLTVNTLYDLRARARKHAELTAARNVAPVSPVSPLSTDGASTHTFDIDLASIWADDDNSSFEAGPSTPYSARFPAAQRAPSPSASFLDDNDEDDEPAPAYEDSQDDHSTWGPASTVRLSTSTMEVEYTRYSVATEEEMDVEQEVLWDENEDPWVAFEAICWASCDVDPMPLPPSPERRRAPTVVSPPAHTSSQHHHHHHLRASSMDTISTVARAPSPLVIAAPLPGLIDAFDSYGRASLDSTATTSTTTTDRSDGAGGLVYKSSFARTQPELALWRAPAAGDTMLVRPLDPEESFELGLPPVRDSSLTHRLKLAERLGLDSASEFECFGREYEDERELRGAGGRALTRLEYVRPRKPSPPRVDAQFSRNAVVSSVSGWSPDTPAPSIGAWPVATRGGAAASGGAKGLRNLWRRATGKENAAAGLGSGRAVYAGF